MQSPVWPLPVYLVHGPNIPVYYAISLFTALNFTSNTTIVTSTTGHCFHFGSITSFFQELFLHSFAVASWAPTYLWSKLFGVMSFCLFILFMGVSRQKYWSGLPFPSPVYHVWSEPSSMTSLSWETLQHGSVSLSYTRLWSMWWVLLVFCDCGFHSAFPLLDKRLVEARWWEELDVGLESRSCSDGQGHAQYIFNPIFCW